MISKFLTLTATALLAFQAQAFPPCFTNLAASICTSPCSVTLTAYAPPGNNITQLNNCSLGGALLNNGCVTCPAGSGGCADRWIEVYDSNPPAKGGNCQCSGQTVGWVSGDCVLTGSPFSVPINMPGGDYLASYWIISACNPPPACGVTLCPWLSVACTQGPPPGGGGGGSSAPSLSATDQSTGLPVTQTITDSLGDTRVVPPGYSPLFDRAGKAVCTRHGDPLWISANGTPIIGHQLTKNGDSADWDQATGLLLNDDGSTIKDSNGDPVYWNGTTVIMAAASVSVQR